MTKLIPSLFSFLFLTIGISNAQDQTQLRATCPDPQPLGYAWKNGGIEKFLSIVRSSMNLELDENAYYFPDVKLQVTSFINSRGQLICEYRPVASEPLFSISLGRPKIENAKK